MPTPPVLVTLSFETVEKIIFFAEDNQAARPAEGVRDSPQPASEAERKIPPLRDTPLVALKKLKPAGLRDGEYKDVRLWRDDATALRDWLRQVGPLLKAPTDQALFVQAAETLDVALQ